MSHWYCKSCGEKKEPQSFEFEENCDNCGDPVEFIDTVRGILFNKLQGDYYELTGEKPLLCAGNVSGGTCCGNLAYVRYLEGLVNPKERIDP